MAARLTLFIAGILMYCTVAAQYKYKYYLDGDFASVEPEKAEMLAKGVFEDSLFRLDAFNPKTGKMLLTAHFTNSMLTVLQGPFTAYYPNGIVMMEGDFTESVQDGTWMMRDSSGNMTDSVIFIATVPKIRATYKYYYSGQLNFYEMTDSINDRYTYKSFFPNGMRNIEASFSGNTGTLKGYDTAGSNIYLSMVGTRERTMPQFPGGNEAYTKYEKENLNKKPGKQRGIFAGIYRIPVTYIVDENGTISDIRIYSRYGHGLEKEAMRFVKSFPPMVPGKIFGVPVSSVGALIVTFNYFRKD